MKTLKISVELPISEENMTLFNQVIDFAAMDSGWSEGYEKIVSMTPIYEDEFDGDGNKTGEKLIGYNEVKEPQDAFDYLEENYLTPVFKELLKQKQRASRLRYKGELDKPIADGVDSLIDNALSINISLDA